MNKLQGIAIAALAGMTAACARGPAGGGPDPGRGASKEPVLRVELGMHGAAVTSIASDPGGRFLVTGSLDKTVRVWDVDARRSGDADALIKTLRPPIGDGKEGAIHAVAVSTDGRTAAAAGWTGYAWDGKVSIYLFDIETGRMLPRIKEGLPNAVFDLAYSKDGRFLAAALGASAGLRVYRTADRALVGRDADYAGDGYGLDFDSAGRLATSCHDGIVRLYEGDYSKPARKARVPGRPAQVRFSPDGALVAVGFSDSPHVLVLDSRDLSIRYSPSIDGIPKDSRLPAVSWSEDGTWLYAGGAYQSGGKAAIRRWRADGRRFQDVPAAGNTILRLAPFRAGVAFASAQPSLGVVGPDGGAGWSRASAASDFKDLGDRLRISAEGSEVGFAGGAGGKPPAVFSVPMRALDPASRNTGRLSPPVTRAPGVAVTGWKDSLEPRLNGRLLLAKPEPARGLAVSPDGRAILIGTEWNLYAFSPKGAALWRTPVPAAVRAVNVAARGPVAVAALGDGTLRWYRVSDGAELIALLALPGQRRWALWTPAGAYDASVGGERLLGWHLGNGPDREADFHPASKFRKVRYRPNVAAFALQGLSEERAVRVARDLGKLMPPVVRSVAVLPRPAGSGGALRLRYAIESPAAAPASRVVVLADGRPVFEDELPAGAGERELVREADVRLPARTAKISVVAHNAYAASDPVSVAAPSSAAGARKRPGLVILSVGITYPAGAGLAPLYFADRDAAKFGEALWAQRGLTYDALASTMTVLTNARATREAILAGLDWFGRNTGEGDVGVLFLSGHGATDENGDYFLLPYGVDSARLGDTAVAGKAIQAALGRPSGRVVLFLDTCHAGGVLGKSRSLDLTGFVNSSIEETGAVVFTASMGSQNSLEWRGQEGIRGGIFTWAILQCLRGVHPCTEPEITIDMLTDKVYRMVRDKTGGRQLPESAKPFLIPNFTFAHVK